MGEIRQVWRGYDPVQVQVGLSVLEVENERLRQRLSDAQKELEFLRETRAVGLDDDGELTRALVLADRAADAVREDALLDAEVIRRQTEAELASVRNDITASKRQLGDLQSMKVSLRDGDASPVATRIAFIIDGTNGVGGDSAAAQRMLEFAELLDVGPRGEQAESGPVPRRVEVPARVKTTPTTDSAPIDPLAPTESDVSVPTPSRLKALVETDVPAPTQGKALAATAETVAKPPLATRRKRVIRKSVETSADQPAEV